MEPTLEIISAIARGAGEILRAGFNRSNHVELKGTIDLVTEVDQQSENYILAEIGKLFPDHQIISEETGGVAGNSDHSWYVDPLDGTTNFAHGLPIFSVSIAYAYREEIILGLVYNPVREELFSAEKGKGAWLNGEPIHTGSQTELEKSLLVTGFPYDRFTNPDNNLENLKHLALKVRGVRRLGSAALDLCYVAAGRMDGYWEIRLEPWDLAAGMLIAREAGAMVTKRDGLPDMFTPPYSVVAANPGLHQAILNELDQN